VGNHTEGTGWQAPDHNALGLNAGTKVFVVKAIAQEHFIKSTNLINETTLQQPLASASIRSTTKRSHRASRSQLIRRGHGLGPTIGIQLEEPIPPGQPKGQVVSAAEMPLTLTIDPHQANPRICWQLSSGERLIATPIEDQMLLVMGPTRNMLCRYQKVSPSVHADRHDAHLDDAEGIGHFNEAPC
jgi:hypothetical protein